MKFGWPINHDGKQYSNSICDNWKGTNLHSSQVKKYLETELRYKLVIGPFKSNPFVQDIGISPLHTRDKKDSAEKRIILDLSFPEGSAVNDGIDKTIYLGVKVDWDLPMVDTLANIMITKGVGSLLFKRDLKHYYRQIFVDPGDIPKLWYQFDSCLYFDATLPMGMTSLCYVTQRVLNAISFLMEKAGYSCVNYIDDLGGADTPEKATMAFDYLGDLLCKIGILKSTTKATPPCHVMVFLGIELNSVSQTLRSDDSRLADIKSITSLWLNKSTATLKEIQSLVGTLSFAASCVREGQLFFSRILVLLKICPKKSVIWTSDQATKDILWWNKFCETFNGVSAIPGPPDFVFSSDTCLTGCGAMSEMHYIHFELPKHIVDAGKYVNQSETYAVLIAICEWKSQFANKNILIYCDNTSTVDILKSGRASCPFMQFCLREIRFHSAQFNFRVRAVHLRGVDNHLSDALSRWHLHPSFQDIFLEKQRT